MDSTLLWDDARVFLAISRCGTLSGAATSLGLGIATVSRRLERLEAALAVPLFSHHQSGYQLTDDGEALLERAEALELAGLRFAETARGQTKVAGCVRLATVENLTNTLIHPSLPKLFAQHPQLRLEVTSAVQAVNLHRREADLAVRLVKPESGNITIKRIGTLGYGLYATARYVQDNPSVLTGDYEHAAFIGWGEMHAHLPHAKWLSALLRGRPCRIEIDSMSTLISATEASLGLAVIPHFLAERSGLTCVQRDLGISQPIWLAIHSDLLHSRRVRVVADHLINLFEAHRHALCGSDA